MAAQTVTARLKRQRELRAIEGWREVTVWVPTEQDAIDIRKLADERRVRAEELHGLSEKVSTVTKEMEIRIAKAIAEHGSAAYITPSGAVLTLLSKLAEEDDLQNFSHAVATLARARPTNAIFVVEAVPAKITNFLVRHRGIDPSALLKWTVANPGWDDNLKTAVRDPLQFEHVVETMAKAIKH